MNPLKDSGTLNLLDDEKGMSYYGDGIGEIEADITLMAENNARERALWGSSVLFAAKRFLQTRGYGIWWKDCKRGLICCDNKILSCRQLVILAGRTRRDLTT